MSEQRAILVSRGPFGWEFADGSKSYMVAADAAGDQPRKRYCAEHSSTVHQVAEMRCDRRLLWPHQCLAACRVVDAIVCVVPSDG